MKANWADIRAEYVAGGISQRKLAEKHGVSYNTLVKKANEEKWADQRNNAYKKSAEKVQQKVATVVASNVEIAQRIKQKLLKRLELEIDKLPENPIGTESNQNAQKREYDDGENGTGNLLRLNNVSTTWKLKDFTSAWKDLTGDLPKVEDDYDDPLERVLAKWEMASRNV